MNRTEDQTLSFSKLGKKWDSADDALDVVKEIIAFQNLKTLELDGNTLGVEAAEAIGNALSKHPEFERALWKDLFTGRLKSEIPTALKHLFSGLIDANARIIELDLSDNALGPVGVAGMIEFIKSPVCYSLKELKLNNNGLGSKGAAMIAKALLDLKNNSEEAGTPFELKVFIVGRNKMENDGAASFSEFFTEIGTLEVIQMPQNSIFHKGIAILAEAFSKNKNLKHINLNDNTFTMKGAESMAKYLPELENLETINFGDCLLRNNGAKKFAECISSGHHKLQNLYLGGNEILLSGALAIVDAVENKPNLQFLGLEDNQIGEEIPEVLVIALRNIGKIDALEYEQNEEPEPLDLCESADESDDEALSNEYELIDHVHQDQLDVEEIESFEFTSPTIKETTAKDFLIQPTFNGFLGLGTSAYYQLVSELKLAAVVTAEQMQIVYEEALVCELLTGVMKVSTVSCNENNYSKECCQKLWEDAFNMAPKLGISFLINSLLIHLGEVKSENKKFKIDWDMKKCLQNLEWLIKLSCVPFEMKSTLNTILSSNITKLSIYPEEVQRLKAVLC